MYKVIQQSSVVQSSTASVQGYMRVGNALYAEVALGGKLLESSVQGFMEQQWENWPLSARYATLLVTMTNFNM